MFKNKWVIYIGFFSLLLVGFFWAISDERPFTDAKLVVINSNIPEFNFIDQDGKSFSTKNTEGKVYVAEYFFTTCKGICPKMNTSMRRIYDAFKNENDFLIVSHTCMPEVDSVPLLKQYERKMLTGIILKNQDGSYKLSHQANDTNQIIENKKGKYTHFVIIPHFIEGDALAAQLINEYVDGELIILDKNRKFFRYRIKFFYRYCL